MNTVLIATSAVACYLAASILIGVRLFRSDTERAHPRWVGILTAFAGLSLHGVLLYGNTFTAEGLNLGFFNALSLSSWTILALLLTTSLVRPVENLGIVLLPLASLTIVLALVFPMTRLLNNSAAWGLKIHVLVSLLAYSTLMLASVQAILLAIQDRHLRNRQPGGFIRALPPLQTMENLLFAMIKLGFILLSFALLSGFMFLEDMFAQHLVHKTALSILSWIVFGTLLWGRFRFGWRGRTAIIWTLSGVVVLMLAYFGSKAVLELILHR